MLQISDASYMLVTVVYITVYCFSFQQEYTYNREVYKRFIPPPLEDLLSEETYAPYDYMVNISLIFFNFGFQRWEN
jgi:hypothetical protein